MPQLLRIGQFINGYPATEQSSGSALRTYVQSLDNMTLLIDPREGGSAITEEAGKVRDIENLGSAGDFSQLTAADQCVWDGSKLIFDRDHYDIDAGISMHTVFCVVKIDTADSTNCIFGICSPKRK